MKLCELFEFSGKGLSKKANFRKELKAFINEPDMDCYECTYPSGVIKQIFNADMRCTKCPVKICSSI